MTTLEKLLRARDREVDAVMRHAPELSYKLVQFLSFGENREDMPTRLIRAQEAVANEMAKLEESSHGQTAVD